MVDLELDILTPLGPKRDGIDVPGVEVPGLEGEMGVLPHHEALITAVVPGVVRFREGATSTRVAVGSGFVEVKPTGRVIVLVDRALDADEIDADEARQDRDETQQQLAQCSAAVTSVEYQSLQTELRWAEARLRAAAGSA